MGNAVRIEPFQEDPSLYSGFSDFTNTAVSTKSMKGKGKQFGGKDEFRFISLSELIKHCEFPRCPLDNHRTALLSRQDLMISFVVFISHTWLRGSSHMPGFNGTRHPDRDDNEKYKLTVEALIKIHRIYAPAFEDIWIWMDFGCINQNNNPADSYHILSDVIYFSDCLLTPIVDDNADTWTYDNGETFDALQDYRSASFHRGSQAYLNRSWCRLEMFFAANLPVKSIGPRKQVSTVMQLYTLNGIRPHFLYGSKESLEGNDPLLLNQMSKDMMERYDPRRGQLTCPSDETIIENLVDKELLILLNSKKPCYIGERNSLLQKHGKGYTVDENGDVYEGEYDTSKKHGYGKMIWNNGDMYEGQWDKNFLHGVGRLVHSDGEIYDGEWKLDMRHGKGKVVHIDGSEYEGDFEEGRMTGHGVILYADNSQYEGDVEDGVREGYGVMIYSNLDVYRGEFSKGNLHGKGDWENNSKHGEGIYKYANGKVYEGEWSENKKHGEGILTSVDGGKYAGRWKKGVWKG